MVKSSVISVLKGVAVILLLFSGWAQAEPVREFMLDVRGEQVTVRTSDPASERMLIALRVSEGDQLLLRWQTDSPLDLHLHGYDIELSVAPGNSAAMRFKAHATGRFPITRHNDAGDHGKHHQTLLYLEVYPR